jgi:hypothetical protein
VTAEIRLGDWRDTLPGTYDPARAVVVTDPPFGIGRADWDLTQSLAAEIRDVLQLLPAVRHVIRVHAPALLQDLPAPRRVCAEVARMRSGMTRPGTVRYGWHPWLVYGRLRVHAGSRGRDWVEVDPYSEGPTPPPNVARHRHTGMTPWQAADWAVRTWATDMLVIDPYAGLATIGLRAQAAGLDYLGAEREPDWHAAATAVLARDQLQLDL